MDKHKQPDNKAEAQKDKPGIVKLVLASIAMNFHGYNAAQYQRLGEQYDHIGDTAQAESAKELAAESLGHYDKYAALLGRSAGGGSINVKS